MPFPRYIRSDRLERFIKDLQVKVADIRWRAKRFSAYSWEKALLNARAEELSLVILKMEDYFDAGKEERNGEGDAPDGGTEGK